VANSLSSKKRIRQNITRAERNKARKSQLKTLKRKVIDALRTGEVQQAQTHYAALTKRLDQLACTSTLHKNTAARTKSRYAKKINAARSKTSA